MMAESLREQHPDVVKVVETWGRWQHSVDYRPFAGNALRRSQFLKGHAPQVVAGDQQDDQRQPTEPEDQSTGEAFWHEHAGSVDHAEACIGPE